MKKPTAFQVIKAVCGPQTLIAFLVIAFLGQVSGLPAFVMAVAAVALLVYAGRKLGRTRVMTSYQIDEEEGTLSLYSYLWRGSLESRKSVLKLSELDSVAWIGSNWYTPEAILRFEGKDGDQLAMVVSTDHIGADDAILLNERLTKDSAKVATKAKQPRKGQAQTATKAESSALGNA